MGAIAPARPGDPLPCLSSNNSIDKPSGLTPYQRKNAFSINENLTYAIERFGLDRVGFLTLTFPKNLTLKEANRRFNSLASNFLDLHFSSWVCVREFTKGGRPHFHLVVICKEDIRTGFNFENYLKMARLSSNPARRRKHAAEIKELSRSLSPTPALRAIWRDLHRVLRLYQFGRHELIPVRKSGAALARYVGGYIRKSMDFRPVEAKGARLITYSKGFPRKVVGHAWAWNTDGSAMWRKKVSIFADLHRVKDLDGLKTRFGPRWAWWFRDVIESLNPLPCFSFTGSEVLTIFNSIDVERFGAVVDSAGDSGLEMASLHLYRPELPLVEGKPVQPPRRLRAAFDFHLSNWSKSRDQIAADSDARKTRHAESCRTGCGVNFTSEQLAAARLRILAPSRVSRAEERARNYRRTYHSRSNDHLTSSN